MKQSYIQLFLMFAVACMGQNTHPQSDDGIFLADPTIFEDGGVYYLYGTGAPDGFRVYRSTDLTNWEGPCGATDGLALKKGDAFGTKGFWAPHVFRYRGRYCMAYTADEYIAVAFADSPLGPFRQETIAKLPTDTKQIDPFVFFDGGKAYLYHVRLQEGNRIFVAELNDDLTAIKEGTLKECLSAESGWEDTQNAQWKVAEGPTVIKRNGKYYLFYSANDYRNIDYAVGYAVSDSPAGPWKKSASNPMISRHLLHWNGTGHGDLFTDGSGRWHYVFHTHFSEGKVAPRRTAIVAVEEVDGAFRVLSESMRLFNTQQLNSSTTQQFNISTNKQFTNKTL